MRAYVPTMRPIVKLRKELEAEKKKRNKKEQRRKKKALTKNIIQALDDLLGECLLLVLFIGLFMQAVGAYIQQKLAHS